MKILNAGMVVLTLHSLLAVGQEKRPDHGSAQKQLSRPRPDLLPLLHKPMDGTIRVKNVGDGEAGSTKMTLDCVKLYMPSTMYSCPNLPIAAMGDYLDFAFPNNVTIRVPKLAPGETFTHTLSFWDVSKWPRGTYKFTVVANAAHTVQESNTANNVATSTLVIP